MKQGKCTRNSQEVFRHAFENKENTLNISCNLNLTDWLLITVHCRKLYFERCILNVHKISDVMYILSKLPFLCWFALLSVRLVFQTNPDDFLLHYSNFFRCPFLSGQCSINFYFTINMAVAKLKYYLFKSLAERTITFAKFLHKSPSMWTVEQSEH